MRKAEFVNRVAAEAAISKVQAEKAVESFLVGIQSALARGDRVTLTGFGTFSTAQRKGRMGRNPQTGAPVYISSRRVPRFAPGKHLKATVASH